LKLAMKDSAKVLCGICGSALTLVISIAALQGGQRQEQPAPEAPMPAVFRNYQPVTADRLLHPEDGNWLMVRRTYDGWGYSPLDKITTANV
jgi:alcohol dehydrogenase (cytochrome c)